ncbi:MAG: phosphate regulon sensor histidine kinase PhoR [Alteromonadaceae bacterium]|nr:phosphate regulon sensor histidine kinase PhoR [Alteromonadaceae bacterium]
MHLKESSYRLFSQLFLLLIGAGIFGYWLDVFWPALLFTTLGILVTHYQQLTKLANWLWQSKSISPPEASGVWGQIFEGLNRKIRKQRSKQKKLSTQIRLFKDGAEALPDGAVVLSDELIIIWANTKALTLIGIRHPSDIGQRVDNLVRFPDFVDYLAKGDFSEPCSIPSPISNDVQIEIRLMPYGSEQFLLLARDISQIFRLETMRRDFVANVSHELKTPLTVVRGYLEMFEMSADELNLHWQKAFVTMENQVTRMDNLVEQLLQLSRVESTQYTDRSQRLAMPKLVASLIDDAKWLNKDKQHHITSDINQTLDILGIESEIKSACANLIANAINYTPAGGEIFISWRLIDGIAVFSVKDNGVGVKVEHVNRLTERFYRVDASRSRDTGGSGLGLAIVKHVLQRHQAKLTIESTYGKGSIFSIVFLQ